MNQYEQATLGGGCFWCMEAVFRHIAGVVTVISGYAGGVIPNPTYQLVSTGRTGHAEVVQITFDPATLSYRALLDIFFAVHDPTTPNRQGADIGPQYRSIILYHHESQHRIAKSVIDALNAAKVWPDPIVTELTPLAQFYPAEQEHQNYFQRHPDAPYCQFMIAPKVRKVQQHFSLHFRNPPQS